MNEEDIKNKIVIPYLADLGLDIENLVFEKTFTIRLFRSKIEMKNTIKGRLDILVKRNNENIFLVETKAPDHILTDDDRDQAISYARLLDNIAPFSIVTNGHETRIYDTITKKELNKKTISESEYVKAGYHISFDPDLIYEAQTRLIELDPDNLLNFCKYQICERISPLRSNDVTKPGIYVPPVFIERWQITKFVNSFLGDVNKNPHYGDEINLVEPGFNSGWAVVQGLWKPNIDERGKLLTNTSSNLVNFGGSGKYSPPELIWNTPIAPTALKFYDTEKMGDDYKNDLFVADANTGSIYHFDLNENRSGLQLQGPLKDKIVEDFSELNDAIFAKGFGRITDLKIGADGYIYVLSSEDDGATLYKITKL